MRVIGGSARGRRIEAPPGRGTRPITDRAKEAIFNMLGSLGALHDEARVLDLFAGSGSFGIESLSRGAAHATFVEMDRAAARTLERNLDHLGFADRAEVLVRPAASALTALTGGPPFDVAFCDPPYALDPWADLLDRLPAPLVVGHAEHDIELTEGWLELRRKTYGRSRILIAERALP
ncbi:MAG: 16S rRNA (guanine(966)-N(2))-methyltransferase RsmD [Actinomycetota bacterium]